MPKHNGTRLKIPYADGSGLTKYQAKDIKSLLHTEYRSFKKECFPDPSQHQWTAEAGSSGFSTSNAPREEWSSWLQRSCPPWPNPHAQRAFVQRRHPRARRDLTGEVLATKAGLQLTAKDLGVGEEDPEVEKASWTKQNLYD